MSYCLTPPPPPRSVIEEQNRIQAIETENEELRDIVLEVRNFLFYGALAGEYALRKESIEKIYKLANLEFEKRRGKDLSGRKSIKPNIAEDKTIKNAVLLIIALHIVQISICVYNLFRG